MLFHERKINKGAFTHPVSTCVFHIALRFPRTYIGSLVSMEKKLLLQKRNAMRKTHAEIGCGNLALIKQQSEFMTRCHIRFLPFIFIMSGALDPP